jgi:HAD superfamily hydrolase (TIGR01662 family)
VRNDQVDPHLRRSGTPRGGPGEVRIRPGLFDAVLLDRDGTLVYDVPYNGDPDLVRPLPGARVALDRLRAAGLRLGVVTNQSGLARGRITAADLARVNARVDELLGPFDTWHVCPHADVAPGVPGCRCRKPAPGLVWDAARALGTHPTRCVLVGDIGADMTAAGAAGASGILVPTRATRVAEIAAAPAVAADLNAAVDLILWRHRLGGSDADPPRRGRRRCVLVARPDSVGDVLVTGPAIRAVAANADRVVMLCGPRGRAAAELLPGVDELVEWRLPWIDPQPGAVDPAEMARLVARLAEVGADEAVVFTSFHQSALPLALLLRMAGVGRISAISDDYPGSLLDVRHRVPSGIPEAERALSLAAAAGFPLPAEDEPRLRLRPEELGTAAAGSGHGGPVASESGDADRGAALPEPGYVVVHPGSSVPARACPPEVCARIVRALTDAGHRVVVTGGPGEGPLTARVAGRTGIDLGGQTSLRRLATIIARAACLVVGNTGPAHLAAAVGVPVVSLFAPTVPFGQWGPFRVPTVRLGAAAADCRHTRATTCPVPGHPCLSGIEPRQVVEAVRLLDRGLARPAGSVRGTRTPGDPDRPVQGAPTTVTDAGTGAGSAVGAGTISGGVPVSGAAAGGSGSPATAAAGATLVARAVPASGAVPGRPAGGVVTVGALVAGGYHGRRLPPAGGPPPTRPSEVGS